MLPPVSDEIQVLKDVAGRLERIGVPYMLSGSMAMHFYAAPRMTRDLDLVAALEAETIPDLVRAFADSYYLEEQSMREGVRTMTPFNLIHQASVVKVDFIPKKKTPYRMLEFSRRLKKRVEDFEVWTVTPEDLILSKLEWSSDSRSAVQEGDIRSILAAQPGLDLEYILEWAGRLGLENAWRKFTRI